MIALGLVLLAIVCVLGGHADREHGAMSGSLAGGGTTVGADAVGATNAVSPLSTVASLTATDLVHTVMPGDAPRELVEGVCAGIACLAILTLVRIVGARPHLIRAMPGGFAMPRAGSRTPAAPYASARISTGILRR